MDETYVRVGGRWVYLYRAVDWCGETIEFMLSPKRDLLAAKHFLQLTVWRAQRVQPRVINVDGHPAYATAVAGLKQSGELGKWPRCRTAPYMNNIVEQDHRFIKKYQLCRSSAGVNISLKDLGRPSKRDASGLPLKGSAGSPEASAVN